MHLDTAEILTGHRRAVRPGRLGARPAHDAAPAGRGAPGRGPGPGAGQRLAAVWLPALLEGRDGQLVRSVTGRPSRRAARPHRRRTPAHADPVQRGGGPGARRAGPPGRPRPAQRAARLGPAGLARRAAPRNEELRALAARIVAAADESRRQIERNLHDGAQQHLVALAVKLGLLKTLIDGDPDDRHGHARRSARRRAGHDHGAARAGPRHLPAAAARPRPGRGPADRGQPAALPTDGGGRRHRPLPRPRSRPPCTSAAWRRIQNAGKHAGDGAVRVPWATTTASLWFEVGDDGAGFDPVAARRGSRLRQHARPARRVRRRAPCPRAPVGHQHPRHAPAGLPQRGRRRGRAAVVVGAGPNGLIAAVTLARAGWWSWSSRRQTSGGRHPHRGAHAARVPPRRLLGVHPLGVGLARVAGLPLAEHGVEWVHPDAPLAHPLDDGPGRGAPSARSTPPPPGSVPDGRPGGGSWARSSAPGSTWSTRCCRRCGPPRAPVAAGPLRVGRHPLGHVARATIRDRRGRRPARRPRRPLDALARAPITAGYGMLLGSSPTSWAGRWPGAARRPSPTRSSSLLAAPGGDVECGQRVTLARRPAAGAGGAARRDPPPARGHGRRPPAGPVPAAARALPVRARRVQGRLGARRSRAVGRPRGAARGTVHLGGTLAEVAAAEAEVAARPAPRPPFVLFAQPSALRPDPGPGGQAPLGPTATCPTVRRST